MMFSSPPGANSYWSAETAATTLANNAYWSPVNDLKQPAAGTYWTVVNEATDPTLNLDQIHTGRK